MSMYVIEKCKAKNALYSILKPYVIPSPSLYESRFAVYCFFALKIDHIFNYASKTNRRHAVPVLRIPFTRTFPQYNVFSLHLYLM